MLAVSFKSDAELGISGDEHKALVAVLGMMERGEIIDFSLHAYRKVGEKGNPQFLNMETFFGHALEKGHCGTAACLAGWSHIISDGKAFPELAMEHNLYFKGVSSTKKRYDRVESLIDRLTVEARELLKIDSKIYSSHIPPVDEVAVALRNFMTTGNPR
jgi:hypothetical protein